MDPRPPKVPGAPNPTRVEDRLARRGGAVELLRLPAALFAGVARLRGALYDRRWLAVHEVETPVVSVGNLTAGGTGKTPFAVWLTQRFVARGLRPGLLSRGYRPRGARGGDPTAPNDEARLLAAALPGVPHVEDPDRVRGAAALERLGVDIIVLDDGFQHRRLGRDLDLVLVDASRPFGLAPSAPGAAPVVACLPRGLLREPPRALSRADTLVLTRADSVPPEALAALRVTLARWAPGVPQALAVHRPTALRALVGPGRALAWLAGREVDLVSGIGNPAAFERTVTSLGAVVGEHRRFRDHADFGADELTGLGRRPVLVTAKDAARVGAPSPAFTSWFPAGAEVHALDIALEVTEGAAALDALLDRLPPSPGVAARAALHAGLHG